MDAVEYEGRAMGSDRATVVVEITRPVPLDEVQAVAKRVAVRLQLSEGRVRRLLHSRVGPISKPVRPEKAEILRRIFEREGLSVATRPSGSERPTTDASALPRPAATTPLGEGSACLSATDDGELPDVTVSAVLAGMVAVAMAGGRPSEAELQAVRLALESMTGTDVGAERIEALARVKGAGNLLQAYAMLTALAPTLTEEQRYAGMATLFSVVDAGIWSLAKAEAAGELAQALRAVAADSD